MTTSAHHQHLSAHQHREEDDLLAGLPNEAASRAEDAARVQLDLERVDRCLQDVVTLYIRHATIAVKLYEERAQGDTATLQHLLAFFGEEGYRADVLQLQPKGRQPGARYSTSHFDIHAEWLPEDTLRYFAQALERDHDYPFSLATNALIASQNETAPTDGHAKPDTPARSHPDASDPMQASDPRTAAAEAQQLALRGLSGRTDGEHSFLAETVALTVQHAALAVYHYEACNENEDTSLQHLLAFFSDVYYRKHVLGIPIPSGGGSWVGFVSEADWLPADTYSFFEHAFCGVWSDELRREHCIGAVNAIALGSARETIGEG